MTNGNNASVPDAVKRSLRTMSLNQTKATFALDTCELDLFHWYVEKTETLVNDMLSSEHAIIHAQIESGVEDINDSGIVAVEYYLKRIRYSHVLYMTSLLETFLERSCSALTAVVDERNRPFALTELKGDQWTVRRKFLEGYAGFSLPVELWSDILVLIALRNILVHDNGSTSALPDQQRSMLKKVTGIRLDGYEVAIDAEYINCALEAIKSVVQYIQKELGALLDSAIHPKLVK